MSDGRCRWDPELSSLLHYPERDDPGIEHWVRILPPLDAVVNEDWDYFVRGSRVLSRR